MFLAFSLSCAPFNFSFYLVPSSALVNGTDLIIHYVKSVRVRSYSGTHFLAFGLSISPYSFRMWKNEDQITPNTDTFYAVIMFSIFFIISQRLINQPIKCQCCIYVRVTLTFNRLCIA